MHYLAKLSATASIVALVGGPAAAQAAESAHEHGVGHLDVAVEGNAVELELTIPGADAVSFEHAPSIEEDRQAIEAAIGKLKEASRLFRFPSAAGCRFEDSDIHAADLGEARDGHDEEAEHGHDDEHDHGKENEHDEAHTEFRAHYHVHCDSPAELTHIDVGFFQVFPTAHELEARWITPQGQGADELTAKAARLEF